MATKNSPENKPSTVNTAADNPLKEIDNPKVSRESVSQMCSMPSIKENFSNAAVSLRGFNLEIESSTSTIKNRHYNLYTSNTVGEQPKKKDAVSTLEVKKILSPFKNNQTGCDKKFVCILLSIALLIIVAVSLLVVAIAAFSTISPLKSSVLFKNYELLLEANIASSRNLLAMEDKAQKLTDTIEYSGLFSSRPAASCTAILQLASPSSSGHYWIRSSNGSAVRVYCDMTKTCGNITGGWVRVAELDMRNSSSQCPSDLTPSHGRNCTGRTCVISNVNAPSCSTTTFSTYGVSHSKICGKIRGYQFRTPDGFRGSSNSDFSVECNYVDGISLTHRSPINGHTHLWTFAAGGI